MNPQVLDLPLPARRYFFKWAVLSLLVLEIVLECWVPGGQEGLLMFDS